MALSSDSTVDSNITTTATSNGLNYMLLRILTAITIKLNGINYILWFQSFRVLVGAQRKIEHLLDGPLDRKDFFYSNWFVNDY